MLTRRTIPLILLVALALSGCGERGVLIDGQAARPETHHPMPPATGPAPDASTENPEVVRERIASIDQADVWLAEDALDRYIRNFAEAYAHDTEAFAYLRGAASPHLAAATVGVIERMRQRGWQIIGTATLSDLVVQHDARPNYYLAFACIDTSGIDIFDRTATLLTADPDRPIALEVRLSWRHPALAPPVNEGPVLEMPVVDEIRPAPDYVACG